MSAIRAKLRGRDALITDVLLETGFRLDDVMNIRIWQAGSRNIELQERKTGKRRSVPISAELAAKIRTYAGNRHRFSFLFPALRRYGAKKMHRSTYWRHFMRAVHLAGFDDTGYSPHSLRKVYAVRLYKRTGDLYAVQRDLNHTHLTTTMLYALSDVL